MKSIIPSKILKTIVDKVGKTPTQIATELHPIIYADCDDWAIISENIISYIFKNKMVIKYKSEISDLEYDKTGWSAIDCFLDTVCPGKIRTISELEELLCDYFYIEYP